MEVKPDIRYLKDMESSLKEKVKGNPALYFMYRGVKEKGNLRYDITVIPPNLLGTEYAKTKGHNHIGKCQETYTVLKGKAIYLMQKTNNNKIEDVYAVETKKGQSIVIPPFYGHVTINPIKKELRMANWMPKTGKSEYSLFENLKGACYYYTTKGWVKNNKYINIPELRFEKPLKKLPKDLSFLK